MTHEYVIAVNGRIGFAPPAPGGEAATAIAWAADRVLAVGSYEVVSSISRGDSTFLDLGGCLVTALPDDLARAVALVGEATATPDLDLDALFVGAGLVDSDSTLEPGSPADLAFWDVTTGPIGRQARSRARLVALVRRGAFTEGDEHHGPFFPPTGS